MGAGAHLEELARTATGDLRLDDALTMATFEEALAEREPGDERIPGLLSPYDPDALGERRRV